MTHITKEECKEIELRTGGQASNFGEICKATDRKDMINKAKRLVSNMFLSTPAILHGVQYELVAVDGYQKAFSPTQEAGLFVSPTMQFLAASLDRIINDSTLLEIKCPYTA